MKTCSFLKAKTSRETYHPESSFEAGGALRSAGLFVVHYCILCHSSLVYISLYHFLDRLTTFC